MAEKKESFIEKMLRSVLISSKGGVLLQKLNYEFKELLGHDLPYKDNGFPNMEMYLRSMPTVVQIRRDAAGQVVCMGVANEETQHLDRLVKKQRATKKRSKPARLPRFAGRPGNRPRRPPPRSFQQIPPPRRGNFYNQPAQRPRQPFYEDRPRPLMQDRPRPPIQDRLGPRLTGQDRPRPTGQERHRPTGQDRPRSATQDRPVPSSQDVRYRNDKDQRPASNQQSQRPPNNQQAQRPPNIQQAQSNQQRPAVNQNPQRNNRPSQPKPQPANQNTQRQTQHSSSYELPPRFRRQIQSTGSTSDEHTWDDHVSQPAPERSHSDSDYQSAVIENTGEWGSSSPTDNESYTRQQPSQPPPVDDKIVSWVNQVLSDKSGGLWMSGLKKLYKEKFQETMEEDLVESLTRLSLWTAEEIGVSNDSILYPNLRKDSGKSLSTEDLRSKNHGNKESNSLAGNDQILYPSLKVEVMESPESGNLRRNVANQSANRIQSTISSSVPPIEFPEDELWELYVSYVINVMDFYCIIIGDEYSDKLCSLEDDMREFYLSENMNLRLAGKPALNGLYAARLDDDWLRVKVIAVQDEEAGCFLVDHGDIESVSFDDLRALNQNFFQLAFQAIPCKLHGLESKAASETATTRFCNVALAQTRMAEVMARESRLSLTLYRDSLNINYLCAMGELL